MASLNSILKRLYLLIVVGNIILCLPMMKCSSITHPDSRAINIINKSGGKVELYWIHPQNEEMVLQSIPHVLNGATSTLYSYVSHTFQVREVPNSKTGKCDNAEGELVCRTGYFAVNQHEKQVFTINEDMEIIHVDEKSMAKATAKELVEKCESISIANIVGNDKERNEAIGFLLRCVLSTVTIEMEKYYEEIAFQANIRKNMGKLFENYTCYDYALPTSEPEQVGEWTFRGNAHVVNVLHDRPASRIHIIKNFISLEQCKVMERRAKSHHHQATVADGKGGSELSPTRKALQAGISIPWHLEAEGDHLAVLSRKIYEYTNQVLGLNIDEHGQEDLMSIKYTGRGEDDEEPDRYMPHCDGDCNGLQFNSGTRIATMIMYCDVPDKGGATNFRNSGIHIVPESGSATFFSYINPETMNMDTGFTEHSGCPVVKGNKHVVTQWIRLGVDLENPWDSFNTLGIKNSDMDD